jgi:hypothetical protein
MSSPQVKSNNPQVKSNSSLSWETILKSPRITKEHVEYAINNADQAPLLPYEFVYSSIATDVKIIPPTTIAISGTGGVIGAILVLRYANTKYLNFVTTKEVVNASEESPLYLSKYALELLKKRYNAQTITIELNEFEKIKLLLSQGGIYISGLPYEITIQFAQLAGFGRLWHFSNINRKFYVF